MIQFDYIIFFQVGWNHQPDLKETQVYHPQLGSFFFPASPLVDKMYSFAGVLEVQG